MRLGVNTTLTGNSTPDTDLLFKTTEAKAATRMEITMMNKIMVWMTGKTFLPVTRA